ncbi:MAG TPA: class I SAM-dependent methyltransferase [bacterium]|nr:class I SAM-dependent methyltransferase [bacterium]
MDARYDEYSRAVAETKVFYDKFALYYDEFVPPKESRTDRVDSLVAYIKKKTSCSNERLRLLELGCGTGSYTIPLVQSGHDVIGVDISDGMREIGIKKMEGRFPPDFEYITSDWLSALQKWRNEFDCILCIGNSLSHNPPSILPTLFSDIFNALKPGGLLILNGRRIERELDMIDGVDTSQGETCRSGGPARVQGKELQIVLRFMFMTKVAHLQEEKTAITFYTYDNYERDGRRFVCHRMLLDDSRTVESNSIPYDSWATKTYFIFEDQLIRVLEGAGFSGVREESPDENHFRMEKNWYVVAEKPIA